MLVRSSSVHSPFILRSRFVPDARKNEGGTKEERRNNERRAKGTRGQVLKWNRFSDTINFTSYRFILKSPTYGYVCDVFPDPFPETPPLFPIFPIMTEKVSGKEKYCYLCTMTVEETIIRNLGKLLTYEQLKEQALAVLVYGTCPSALNLTPQQEAEMKVLIGKYMRQHLRLNQDLATVFTHLQRNGLHPVLLKGQGCASYYPNPYLRATGDLDIWIGQEKYEKAKEVLKELDIEIKKEDVKHLDVKIGNTTIELHRLGHRFLHPIHAEYFNKLTEGSIGCNRNMLQHISCYSCIIDIPPIDYNALYVFMHLWFHFSDYGIGLRQFVDLAFILHKDSHAINHAKLEKQLRNLGRLKAWRIVGCLLVNVFGLPSEKFPLYLNKYEKQARILFKLVLEEGNFGKKKQIMKLDQSLLIQKYNTLLLQTRRSWAICRVYPEFVGEIPCRFAIKFGEYIKEEYHKLQSH